jgi:hypothetical protein
MKSEEKLGRLRIQNESNKVRVDEERKEIII